MIEIPECTGNDRPAAPRADGETRIDDACVPRRKLDVSDEEIAGQLAVGASQTSLSRKYGVARLTIRRAYERAQAVA